MKRLQLLLLSIITGCYIVGCQNIDKTTPISLKADEYLISFADNGLSEKWANYLHNHLQKRSKNKDIISLSDGNIEISRNKKEIIIDVQDSIGHDYNIEHSTDRLIITTKTERTALWITYQLIKQIANEDDRFLVNDIPPAIIEFYTGNFNFDFAYREPYYRENLEPEQAPILGNNMLENDWGIWGHNLGKILKEDNKNLIFAKVNGKINKNQFCFSNDEIYKQLSSYIIETFGNGAKNPKQFMIMPNDNNIVCDCKLCISKGNTKSNATPAITYLITELANKFPNHIFFTSAYLSTITPPTEELPKNTGVMISTIDLPKGVRLNNQAEVSKFKSLVNDWRKTTHNIYIWDYASNFDDYLTPTPVLFGFQKQLPFFKEIGISGIFLNASGYDYSSFDDLKTFVCSALMKDMSLSIYSLCQNYLTQFYPTSSKILCDYYLSLEKDQEKKEKPYGLYNGFRETLNSDWDEKAFVDFYNSLDSLIVIAQDEEKQKLIQLQIALSFTRLQLAFFRPQGHYGFKLEKENKDIPIELKTIVERLSRYKDFEDLSNYAEANGSLEKYISSWEDLLIQKPQNNLLDNLSVKVLSQVDEGFEDLSLLTDGILAFQEDYHQGWYLSSKDDFRVQIDCKNLKDKRNLFMQFLVLEKHGIYPPQKIIIYKDGKKHKVIKPAQKSKANYETSIVQTEINFQKVDSLLIVMYRKKFDKSIIAIDEILIN